MSDNYIPLDIQTHIMKKLPVNSLIRFRCVSKQWKSLIDSSKFIKSYQNTMNHLLVRYSLKYLYTTEFFSFTDEYRFVSIIDNNATIPQHKSPITVPMPVNIRLQYSEVLHLPGNILGSSHGLICFYGFLFGNFNENAELIVLWNPSIRKSVGIVIPNKLPGLSLLEYVSELRMSCIGFGVCPETNDPKIVKINTIDGTPYGYWEVQVYTLSSKVWKKVSVKPPCKKRDYQQCEGVSVKGFIYWLMYGEIDSGVKSNLIASFDLTNEEFGQVYLPDGLLRSPRLRLSKRNECLTVLDYEADNNRVLQVCNVWMMKDDDVTKSFTKMFSIKLSGRLFKEVLEFGKNGDAIIETIEDDGHSVLQVYDPSLGHISGDMGMDGSYFSFSVRSYMETLLLLDE
ncbi:putative F-box domain-containing protein [Tanacetum coccineum]|uniref:F-box domain-containing protein n=1 Tax=Tanacetum coccineum TaxID=301880 RepID=A0ABQ5EAK5_9ASTR